MKKTIWGGVIKVLKNFFMNFKTVLMKAHKGVVTRIRKNTYKHVGEKCSFSVTKRTKSAYIWEVLNLI